MSITVYTKPACQQCNATTRQLDKQGLDYDTVDVTENADALKHIKELGYLSAPVVETEEGEHWSGYRPDSIKALAKEDISASNASEAGASAPFSADPFGGDPFSARGIAGEFGDSEPGGGSSSPVSEATYEAEQAAAM